MVEEFKNQLRQLAEGIKRLSRSKNPIWDMTLLFFDVDTDVLVELRQRRKEFGLRYKEVHESINLELFARTIFS